MARRGKFIVLEGPDKSGKSTQAALLVQALKSRGIHTLHTREPGGTSFAEAIRRILLDPKHRVHPLAELLLYEAARAQHTQELLLPALSRGESVLCERYTLATLAYQGYGRGLPLALIRQLNRVATFGLKPDLTLVLDVPESQFQRRDPRRRHDRLEMESAPFRRKVRRAYRLLARGPRTTLIPASGERQNIHRQILSQVLQIL